MFVNHLVLVHSDVLIVGLDIARWTIILENFSQIQMHTQGWGPNEASGIDPTTCSLPKESMIYLRPDDVFQIGHVTLQIQREVVETQGNSTIQVTSSGFDGATADQQHVNQDKENKEALEFAAHRRHPISTPHSSRDIDTTIMETPVASRYDVGCLGGSTIMSAATETGLNNHGDCQKRESDSNSPDIQTSITEGIKRTNEVSELPIEELTSEPPKSFFLGADDEDSQKSIRDRSDKLLDLADSGQDGLSSPISHSPGLSYLEGKDGEECSKRSGTSSIEAADIIGSPPTLTTRKSSRKRKRATDESQDSMKSLIRIAIPPSSARAKYAKQQSLGREPARRVKASNELQDVSDPPSSSRSKRLKLSEDSSMTRATNTKLRVFFGSSTTVDKSSKFMGFLENHGVMKVKSVKDCDILCIGNSDLKKTGNLVLAVMSGKQVITKDWVVQSVAKGELLDPNGFLARDPVKEAEWETDLDEAIKRGKQGVKPFLDFTVFFTPAAKKELGTGFTELKDIAIHAGAKSVQATLPRKSSLAQAPKTIVIALPGDSDLLALEEGGWRSFNKDIVTLSVLRGSVNVNSDEFLVRHQDKNRTVASKRRKR